MENALSQVKWELDWLLKAHIGPNQLVVMVGDPDKDHQTWGRPEGIDSFIYDNDFFLKTFLKFIFYFLEINERRPTYIIDQQNPGTEPAAEAAAALAAGSILFAER